MNNGEVRFERDLAKLATYLGCIYEKVPDVIITKSNIIKRNGKSFVAAKKRFADGVLITPKAVFILECKYNDGQLKPHQKQSMNRINQINESYYILRKRAKVKDFKTIVTYYIQNIVNNRVTTQYKTESLKDIILWFKEKNNEDRKKKGN